MDALTRPYETGPEDLRVLLEGRDRRAAPMGAPAHGLFLHEVVYPEELLDWKPPPEEEEEEGDVEEDMEEKTGRGKSVEHSIGLRDMLNSQG
jgi:hypothetical protein